jgi:hypothetical protein
MGVDRRNLARAMRYSPAFQELVDVRRGKPRERGCRPEATTYDLARFFAARREFRAGAGDTSSILTTGLGT